MHEDQKTSRSGNGFIFNFTGDSFSVNQSGAFVLRKLKEGESEEKIMKMLQEEYDLDGYTAEKT